MYIDAEDLYDWAMSESLQNNETKFDKTVKLEDILNRIDDSDIGYFLDVDLRYPDNIKEKTNQFPFALENNPQDKSKG